MTRPVLSALILLITITGCATPPSAYTLLPVTGKPGAFQVHEYAIVEQSIDNPNHAEFQQRVQAIVSASQSGWHFPGQENSLEGPNRTLAPFGFHLTPNPTPPFSAYALYRDNVLVQRDIIHFWPVSTHEGSDGNNFMLAFQTMKGDKLVASLDGIRPWPKTANGADPNAATPPVFYGDQIAFAETNHDEITVYAGLGKLYSGAAPQSVKTGTPAHTSDLHTWGKDHWALELAGDVIVDGVDLNANKNYQQVFNWQLINNQPFYFFTRGDIIRMNYAGEALPYTYDQVIHDQTGQTAMFNPGSNDQIVWFYALRDGLWYYVEAGLFN